MKTMIGGLDLSPEVQMLANIWRITRRDGQVFRFTDWTDTIQFSSGDTNPFLPAIGLMGTGATKSMDLSTDNVDVEGLIDSVTIKEDELIAGVWNGCEVEVFAVDVRALPTPKYMWVGRFRGGAVTSHNGQFSIEFRGLSDALSRDVVEVTTPSCRYTFGDSRCTKSVPTYIGTVVTVFAAESFNTTVAQVDNFFQFGDITWSVGSQNAGLKMEVKASTNSGGGILLQLPMPKTPAIGDGFTLRPGCAKTVAACKGYSNFANYGGEPFIPGQDKVLLYGRFGTG